MLLWSQSMVWLESTEISIDYSQHQHQIYWRSTLAVSALAEGLLNLIAIYDEAPTGQTETNIHDLYGFRTQAP